MRRLSRLDVVFIIAAIWLRHVMGLLIYLSFSSPSWKARGSPPVRQTFAARSRFNQNSVTSAQQIVAAAHHRTAGTVASRITVAKTVLLQSGVMDVTALQKKSSQARHPRRAFFVSAVGI